MRCQVTATLTYPDLPPSLTGFGALCFYNGFDLQLLLPLTENIFIFDRKP